MFLILVGCSVLSTGVIWQCSGGRIRQLLNWMLPVFLSIAFISFYFNGEDWVNYYYALHEFSIDPYLIYEPLFVAFFLSLQAIFNDNFGYAVSGFYLIIFLSIVAVVKRMELNPHFFFVFFILAIGNTFILEQIRQLMAGVFILWSFYWLLKRSLVRASIFMIAAVLSHSASVIMILVFGLILLREKIVFIFSTVALGFIFVMLIFNMSNVLPYFDWLGFAFGKINSYLDAQENFYSLGYFAILDFLFILYFLFTYEAKEPLKKYLMRIAFTGALFQFSFNFFPVMLRFVSFHYVFIALLLAMELPKIASPVKFFHHIAPVGLSITFMLFAFSSYYRNPLHPVEIFNFDISGVKVLFGDYDINAIAADKFMAFEEKN